jgi:dihydropteroate synthase
MNKPIIMGIVNVTPDSFSDGGKFAEPQRAVDQALQLIKEGASIIDIGGESTRPGATPVSAPEEIDRILPVVEGLKSCGVIISVDTFHAATMKAALAAGAKMINDITALRGDPESMGVVAAAGVPVSLMHMQGEPGTMQDNPVYEDVVQDVFDFLKGRIAACQAAGIAHAHIIADPGIGFGKAQMHNLCLLKNLDEFAALGVPLMIGISRKSFIEKIDPGTGPDQRLPGSLAASIWAWQKGATFFRVHDVEQTRQAFTVYQAIQESI